MIIRRLTRWMLDLSERVNNETARRRRQHGEEVPDDVRREQERIRDLRRRLDEREGR